MSKKGLEGGACNRQSCQVEPALWYNHGMHKWYCHDCARDIGDDHVNRMGWNLSEYYPGHPQFETREQIDERKAREEANKPPEADIDAIMDRLIEPYFFIKPGRAKPQSNSLKRLLSIKRKR